MSHEVLVYIEQGKVYLQNKPAGIVVRLLQTDSLPPCIVGEKDECVKEYTYSRKHTVKDLGEI